MGVARVDGELYVIKFCRIIFLYDDVCLFFFFFQAEDGIRDLTVTGVQTCALPISFQLNHERLMSRWPRFVELYEWSRPAGGAQALVTFTARDWRDLQVLSQLAWIDRKSVV